MSDKIYTHEEAANIIELFEDLLDNYRIRVPSPEDDDRDPGTSASLYGSVYSELLDEIEDRLLCIIERVKSGDKVVEYVFEGCEENED